MKFTGILESLSVQILEIGALVLKFHMLVQIINVQLEC